MSRLLTVLAGALVLTMLGACGSDGGTDPAPSDGGGSLANTSWTLTEYAPKPGSDPVAAPSGVRATAQFTTTQVTGSDGCNAYRGAYTATDGSLSVSELAGTKKACSGPAGEVSAAFGPALRAATAYAIDGETLTLSGAGDADLLIFTKAQPTALAGPTWSATGINNGKQAVQSLVEDTQVTAVFTEDGKVSGTGGCNRYSGTYESEGTSLTFGELASTLIACDEAVSTQESNYLAALDKVTTFTIDGDVLELRDDEGALQVSYEATTK